jgi:hypothetical protein
VRFGVASGTEDQFAGVLGLGYGDGINLEYRNFVDELAHQGVTETRAFSIGLGSKLDGDGVMVFGGVDTAKFGGKLAALPIIPAAESPDKVARYWVQMVSMSMSSSGSRGARSWEGANDLPVFLDTGGTLTLLPSSLVEDIAADFDSPGLDDAGYYTIDCTFVDEDGTVDFEFDGVTIRVPFREVIRKFNNGGSPSCYLGIAPSDKFALLGDTFLRAAYGEFCVYPSSVCLPSDN